MADGSLEYTVKTECLDGVAGIIYLLGRQFTVKKPFQSFLEVFQAAATLHDYLAARILWLIFPIFLLYLVIFHRALFRAIWRPTVAGLVGAGLLVIPMFAYVQRHPEADRGDQCGDVA